MTQTHYSTTPISGNLTGFISYLCRWRQLPSPIPSSSPTAMQLPVIDQWISTTSFAVSADAVAPSLFRYSSTSTMRVVRRGNLTESMAKIRNNSYYFVDDNNNKKKNCKRVSTYLLLCAPWSAIKCGCRNSCLVLSKSKTPLTMPNLL